MLLRLALISVDLTSLFEETLWSDCESIFSVAGLGFSRRTRVDAPFDFLGDDNVWSDSCGSRSPSSPSGGHEVAGRVGLGLTLP